MLSTIEQTRLRVSKRTDGKKKSELGQFFTPSRTAEFMAGLFPQSRGGICTLLDAGAGIGSLTSAFLERCISGNLNFDQICLKVFEIDDSIHLDLYSSILEHISKVPISFEVFGGDFIEIATDMIKDENERFTHAILNPPYKKIGSASVYRLLLRETGIEVVNLYSAFVALVLLLMQQGGQVVAIIPRSFCNGPYYRPFREFLLRHSAIRQIHLFNSRNTAFKDDGVLQENIIIRLERGGIQGSVEISTSTDDTFSDLNTFEFPFNRILLMNDREKFIHIPSSAQKTSHELSLGICHSLSEIGLQVSTGPIVDFRLREYLREMPEIDTIPLIYPAHFDINIVKWPKENIKKANAIKRNHETEKWLYPNGFYCVVRRFSSKEEKRRIVANMVDPSIFVEADMLGFENHLNLFHENKHGLPKALARGLSIFLNSTTVDEYFRIFSGHTQVNATDLKQMKYPSRAVLCEIGEWDIKSEDLTQSMIDEKIRILTQ